MKRKIVFLLLALTMAAALPVPAGAGEMVSPNGYVQILEARIGPMIRETAETSMEEAERVVREVGIMIGYGNGDFGRDDLITGAQYACVMGRVLGMGDATVTELEKAG